MERRDWRAGVPPWVRPLLAISGLALLAAAVALAAIGLWVAAGLAAFAAVSGLNVNRQLR